MISTETLAAIRAAVEPSAPAVVRWAPAVRHDLCWPALAQFHDPSYARMRDFADRLMREYVLATFLPSPRPVWGVVDIDPAPHSAGVIATEGA